MTARVSEDWRLASAEVVGGTALAVAATTGTLFVVRRRKEIRRH